MLIAMAGLPGTGKSTLARRLAKTLPAVLLDKDPIRATLFPPSAIEYSTRQDDFVVQVMLDTALYLFENEPQRNVIIDGRPFSRRYQLERLARFAIEHEVKLAVLLCICSDQTARRRLNRARGRHLAANRDFGLYLRMKSHFEPLLLPHLVINTDLNFEENLELAQEYLYQMRST